MTLFKPLDWPGLTASLRDLQRSRVPADPVRLSSAVVKAAGVSCVGTVLHDGWTGAA